MVIRVHNHGFLPLGGYSKKEKVAFLKYQRSCNRYEKLVKVSFDGLYKKAEEEEGSTEP